MIENTIVDNLPAVSPVKGESGFTLMELLVVIAIFATLASIAMFAMGPTLKSYRVKGAARQVYSDALKVRSRAIKEGKVSGLEFSGSDYVIWSENDPNRLSSGLSSYGELSVCGSADTDPPEDFIFLPNGTALGGNIRISLSGDDYSWKVYVPNKGTGSVKIKKSTSCP